MNNKLRKKNITEAKREIARLCRLIANADAVPITPNFSTDGYKLNPDGSYEATYYLSDGSCGQPRRKVRTGS